jgi:hypothetical protein
MEIRVLITLLNYTPEDFSSALYQIKMFSLMNLILAARFFETLKLKFFAFYFHLKFTLVSLK